MCWIIVPKIEKYPDMISKDEIKIVGCNHIWLTGRIIRNLTPL